MNYPNMASNRPQRVIRPAQKLGKDNIGELLVKSHKDFVKASNIDLEQPSTPTSPSELPDTDPSSPGSVVPDSESVYVNGRKRRALSDVEDSGSNNNNTDNASDNSQSQVTEPQAKTKQSKKKSKKKTKTSQSMSSHHSSFISS